jgi:catalase (peroxidase I)
VFNRLSNLPLAKMQTIVVALVVFVALADVCTAFAFKRNALVMSQSQSQSQSCQQGPQSAQSDYKRDLLGVSKAMGIVGAIVVGRSVAPAAFAASGVDYSLVRADIDSVYKKDPNRGPTLVRLSWHSSGTYDKISKTGGSGKGTIRFREELAHGANAGLTTALEWLVSGLTRIYLSLILLLLLLSDIFSSSFSTTSSPFSLKLH